MRRKNHVGFVDFTEREDEDEKPRLCPHCSEFNMQNKLGPRVVRTSAGETEAGPDWDQFLMCVNGCGRIYGLYEVKSEQLVSGFTQTTDNPFESQKGIVESIPKRSSPAGKKALEKRKRERLRAHDEDPEIDALLKAHGDNVRIIK